MVQYAQMECHDCHGIFPGNEMKRIGQDRESGRSYREEDAHHSAKHRVYTSHSEILVCKNCRRRRRHRTILKWTALIAAGVGLYQLANHWPRSDRLRMPQADASNADNESVANQSGADADADTAWTLTETTDPLNDVLTQAATKNIQGEHYIIQATIKCVGFENLLYEFSAFDGDNKGVEMTRPPDATAMLVMRSGAAPLIGGGSPFITSMIRFAVRADDAKAQMGTIYNPKYANRLIISTKTIGVQLTDISSASHLLVRLPTHGGDETINIDQTDPNVVSVLQTCNWGNLPPGTGEFNGPQPGEAPVLNKPRSSDAPDEAVNASEPGSTGNVTL